MTPCSRTKSSVAVTSGPDSPALAGGAFDLRSFSARSDRGQSRSCPNSQEVVKELSSRMIGLHKASCLNVRRGHFISWQLDVQPAPNSCRCGRRRRPHPHPRPAVRFLGDIRETQSSGTTSASNPQKSCRICTSKKGRKPSCCERSSAGGRKLVRANAADSYRCFTTRYSTPAYRS